MREQQSQQKYLFERIIQAKCSVVGVQEVYGASREESSRVLEKFRKGLEQVSGRSYSSVLGDAQNDQIRNGFLFQSDLFEIKETLSMRSDLVPQIDALGPPTRFTRMPLALWVKFKPDPTRDFLFVNFHFKSKAGGWKDPAGLDWEVSRMEMAQAIRDWAEAIEAKRGESLHLILLGDRNAGEGEASVEILRGSRDLNDFKRGAGCRLTKDLAPECQVNNSRPPRFVGLLSLWNRAQDRATMRTQMATYSYRGKLQIIDEILVEPEDLALFTDTSGLPFAGVEGTFNRGSDHKLVWAEVNW